jgi:Arc/MetJ family transcription regulator
MRTNIVLDDRLVKKAMRLTGSKTKRQVVQVALERLVTALDAERQQEERSRVACHGLLSLRGIGWDDVLPANSPDRVVVIGPPEAEG